MYDLLENHAFDAFYFWWEQQHGEFKPNTPEWDNFWEGMNTLNDGTFFNFDWETEEWVINKGGEEYRFPRSWLYEELQDEPDLVMLWHAGYYDGPLNGMALYNGQYVWFDCFSDDYQEPYYGMRVYRLYELSEKEMKEQFNHHSKFRKYVGHHTDYGSAYAPFEGKSREEMDKFYKDPKRIQPSKNFTKNKMLGEFTDVQFRRDRPLSSKTQEGTVSDE
jgi:hypothetical protein